MNQNETAFPWTANYQFGRGLTKRELFAAMAMQAIINCPLGRLPCLNVCHDGSGNEQEVARAAVIIADALIVELEK